MSLVKSIFLKKEKKQQNISTVQTNSLFTDLNVIQLQQLFASTGH